MVLITWCSLQQDLRLALALLMKKHLKVTAVLNKFLLYVLSKIHNWALGSRQVYDSSLSVKCQ